MKPTAVLACTLLCCLAVPDLGVSAGEPGRRLGQERDNAAGFLELRRQQKTYRDQAGDLAPSRRMELDRGLRRQERMQGSLQHRQIQRSNTERKLKGSRPGFRDRDAGITAGRNRREQQSQMLRFRSQRSTWPRAGRPDVSRGSGAGVRSTAPRVR